MATELLELEHMALNLSSSADWRRRKADEFPDDAERNLKAAKYLDMVADSMPSMEGSELHRRISNVFFSAEDGYEFSQTESEITGSIYFDHTNGESYFEEVVDAVAAKQLAA